MFYARSWLCYDEMSLRLAWKRVWNAVTIGSMQLSTTMIEL